MTMQQIDPGAEAATVDDNMTDAERAAYADAADAGAAAAAAEPAAPAAPAEPAAAAEPAAPAAEAQPDPTAALAAAADKLGAAAEAIAARAVEPAAPAAPAAAETPPRDFDTELTAIDTAYDEGEIDLREYNRKRDEIRDAQADLRLEQRLAAERTERETRDAKAREDAATAGWEGAKTAFFADAGNAALVDNPIKAAAFQAAIHEAGKEVTGGDWTALLAKARELVGGAPPAAADQQVRQAVNQRQQQEPTPAQTLRDVPNSGGTGEAPGAALDGLPISELEDVVARMGPDKLEQWLSSAPGGLADHPRAVD